MRLIGFILLLLFFQNVAAQERTSPTYREVLFASEGALAEYFQSFDPKQATKVLESDWSFLGKDSLPGISRSLPDFRAEEPIPLPHSSPLPNHSFWYQTQLELKPGILWIDADDGAQLWVNGQYLARSPHGNYYELAMSGQVKLTVRVVNNAMAGGLRQLRWMGVEEFDQWHRAASVTRSAAVTERKKQLLTHPLKLKDQPLDSLPVLLSEPVLLGSRGKYYLKWVSEMPGKSDLVFEDGSRVSLSSEDGIFTWELDRAETTFKLFQRHTYHGEFSFQLPKVDDTLRLAVWGDSQGGWEKFDLIAKAIAKCQPDYSLGAGDLVNNGAESMVYARFLQKASLMKTVQIPVPGNHDYDGSYDDLVPTAMTRHLFLDGQPTYGIQYIGSMALMTLDPNENFPVDLPEETAQRQWMSATINSQKWKESTWKIISLHQPPFSQGWPGYEGEERIRNLLMPYFHRGLVDLVIAGHTHDYERLSLDFSGNTVHFLVVGGAGGGLEPEGEQSKQPVMDKLIKKHHFGIMDIDPDQIVWTVIGLDEERLDSFVIKK